MKTEMRKKVRSALKRIALGSAEIALMTAVQTVDFGVSMIFQQNQFRTIRRALRNADVRIQRSELIVSRLLQKGHVAFSKRKNGTTLVLTEKGRRALRASVVKNRAKMRTAWDGKWRLVLYSISEAKRAQRDALRYRLERGGFKKIGESVWLYPYPCSELIQSIREELQLTQAITLVTAESIENDESFKKRWKLQ
jgi:DNA-binding transcriptional regulator PaaX